MSRLIIVDLNFFESEFPKKGEVKGGGRNLTPRVSTAVKTSVDTDVKTSLNTKKGTYTVSDAVASAAAGALCFDCTPKVDVGVKAEAD